MGQQLIMSGSHSCFVVTWAARVAELAPLDHGWMASACSCIDVQAPPAWRMVQVDVADFSGPDFKHVDNRFAALTLVQKGLCDAALFTPSGALPRGPCASTRHHHGLAVAVRLCRSTVSTQSTCQSPVSAAGG